MKYIGYFSYILSLLLLVGQGKAHNKAFIAQGMPLSEALEVIEKCYAVKFSYADTFVEGRNYTVGSCPKQPLAAFLDGLETKLGLRFEQVSPEFVVVRPFGAEDFVPVKGKVVGPNGQPLANAALFFNEGDGFTVTDAEGDFEFDRAPYFSSVIIKFMGYHSESVSVKTLFANEGEVVALKEDVKWLKPITVSSYLTTGIRKYTDRVVIQPQNLGLLPGLADLDLLETVQLMPGVYSPYETASGMHVRGGSPDQNLVLWNGIKIYNQGHFFGMVSAFNPQVTDQVDFIKNGTSAVYGDRVAGVIDIKSGEQVAKRVKGSAGVNLLYGDLNVAIPIIKDKVSVQFAGRRSHTDMIETITYDKMSERVFQNTKIDDKDNGNQGTNDFFFQDLSANTIVDFSPKNKLFLNNLYQKNNLNFQVQSTGPGRELKDELFTQNEGHNIRWVHHANPNFALSVEGYYSNYTFDYRFKNIQPNETAISSKLNQIRDFGGDFKATFNINEKHLTKIGYQFSHNHIAYAFEEAVPELSYQVILNADNSKGAIHAIYGEHQYRRGDKTTVNLGVRTNYFDFLDIATIEPRLSAKQHLSNAWSINASLEYKSQAASQIQESVVSDLALERNVWTLASNDIFPMIKSKQFSFGATFEKNGWMVDIEPYYKRIDDITSLTFEFRNPLGNNYLTGRSDVKGLDFFLKKTLGDYRVWASYTFSDIQNRFGGVNNGRPFPSNWNTLHALKISQFFDWKKFQFALGWQWHSGKAYTDLRPLVVNRNPKPIGGPIQIIDHRINDQNLPSFHRLDFSANYRFNGGKNSDVKYQLGISLRNIYNQENILNREYRLTPGLDSELVQTTVLGVSFMPNAVLRVFW